MRKLTSKILYTEAFASSIVQHFLSIHKKTYIATEKLIIFENYFFVGKFQVASVTSHLRNDTKKIQVVILYHYLKNEGKHYLKIR